MVGKRSRGFLKIPPARVAEDSRAAISATLAMRVFVKLLLVATIAFCGDLPLVVAPQ